MSNEEREAKKVAIVQEIMRNKGFKTIAVKTVGVSFPAFYEWMQRDPDFKDAVDAAVAACRDYRDDLAEQKLLENVEAGDTASVIFYNKTRNKHRGYTEKPLPPDTASATAPAEPHLVSGETSRRIAHKKTYFIKLLKEQGKYTPELAVQVKMAAELSIRVETLAEEIFSEGHKAVTVEYSREGNSRERISEKEKLFLGYCSKLQSALKAIGMTTDAKDRRDDGKDELSEFLQSIEGEI